MFQYKVKSYTGSEICMNVLSETDDSLYVHIVTIRDGYEMETREPMARRLFETLLATGYLMEVESAMTKAKSA
ncbi:MAG: hypothetical protein LBK13_01770 [Spirochaetales bacterium]|jgi:hypothetical protein|nr:hypothetical protein [Spirochaetales bacterium]